MALADGNTIARVWKNVKEKLFNNSIVSASVNGKTVTFTRGDGTTFTIETKDTTYNDMTGATTTAAGTRGLVPAPDKGSDGRYLSSDGTWKVPPNQKYNVFRGATASAAGDNGLVPAPESGKQDSFLKGDGTWGTPTNTTYGVVSKSANGLAPKLPDETTTTKYLRQDGTWAVPPDNDTTYSVFKGATASNKGQRGLVPEPQIGANKGLLFGNGVWSNVFLDAYDLTNGCEIVLDANNSDIGNVSSAIVPLANANRHGLISTTLFSKISDLPTATELSNTYAKKTDISTVYRYCGSVENASKLPTTGQNVGDTYNIIAESKYGPKGENVTWNGTEWDPNGGMFEIVTLTDDEIDEICS